jgi:outer membrane translocation and assembly module TamA
MLFPQGERSIASVPLMLARMRCRLLPVILIGLGSFTAPGGAQLGAAAVQGARVATIRFVSAAALQPPQLREVILTRESRCRSPLLYPVCRLTDAGWAEETAFLDALQLRADEQRLEAHYATWGYPNASVTARAIPRADRSVAVRFEIQEGEPIRLRSLEIVGLERVPEPMRVPPLPLRPGDVYSLPRLEAAQQQLVRPLAELGYAFAEVAATGELSPDGRFADVVLEVVPGPRAVFGPTQVLPEPPVSAAVVQRRLAYQPGERFTPAAMERTTERLHRLSIIQRVHLDVLRADPVDSVVIPVIGIASHNVQGLWFGGGISSTTCLEGALGWGHRYLFGGPRLLTLNVGGGNLFASPLRRFPCTGVGEDEFEAVDYRLGATLREPLGPDTWLLLGGQVSRETAPRAFVERGIAAQLGLLHVFARHVEAGASYLPHRSSNPAGAVLLCGVFDACDEAAIEELTRSRTLAPLELSFGWVPPEARIAPQPPPPFAGLDPRPPWVITGSLGGAAAGSWSGSEFRYGRILADAAVRRRLGRPYELAARVAAGALFAADEALPPQTRFYGGGPRGVRAVGGFLLGPQLITLTPEQALELGCDPQIGGCTAVPVDPRVARVRPTGGERIIEANLEGRVWISRFFQLTAFVDYGLVHNGAPAQTPAAMTPSESLLAPGIGVLALSPFGPVRLDLAYNPSAPRRRPLLVSDPLGPGYLPVGDALHDPFAFDQPGRFRETIRRLQFQLSLGQPF